MKKFLAFILSLSCCLSICCSSISAAAYSDFDILNPNYAGTYYMVGIFNSWITVRSGGCDVHIVYDKSQRSYISSTGGSGYINNNYFRASYNSFSIVDQDGNRLQNVYDSTTIEGNVNVDLNENFIDININGMIYEKSFK